MFKRISIICAVLVLSVTPTVLAKQHHKPTKPPVPPVVVPSGSETTLSNVYTTGYSSYDNTPKGSTAIFLNGISGNAGGDGTYANPTTLAVGHSIIGGKDIGDFAYGTLFYVPKFEKYFVAQDSCGDGSSPQTQPCHNLATADKGATLWLDLYVGASTSKAVLTCEDNMTGLNTVIENPASTYPVVVGNIC